MREISTEPIKIGEHFLVDGVEYVGVKYAGCKSCAFHDSRECLSFPCPSGVIFKRVKKEIEAST